MKKYIFIIGVALLPVCVMPTFSQVSKDNEDEVYKIDTRWLQNDFVPGQVLVKFKDAQYVEVNTARGQFRSTSVNRITQTLQKYGAEEMEQLLPREIPHRKMRRAKAYNGDVVQERDLSQLYLVKLSNEHIKETIQLVDELKMIDEVEFAEPNYRVYAMADINIADDSSGNPLEGQQWYLDAYGVKELWNKPIINKERPVIAILDTGVDLTHPDLKDNLWTNAAEEYGIKDNDNDGNGFKNDVHGWDFVNNSANIRDNNMHGTHVAGIAAAANNGVGIVGANPQALIMPITVLQSDGTGDVAKIVKGIDYATQNGAKIINMSLGLYINSQVLRHALENAYQKAVIVAAAGNDGKCINAKHWKVKHDDPEPQSMPMFPAAYSFVLGVQATEKEGSVASFSNYDDDEPNYSEDASFFDPDAVICREGNDQENSRHLDEQSRSFGNLFPSLTLSTQIKNTYLQLGYAAKARRPTYQQLSNNVSYGNRFLMQSGNPFLDHEYIHSLSLIGVYKYLQVVLAYSDRRDAIIYWVEQQAGNSAVSRISYQNIPTLKNLTVQVVAAPKFGIWSPQLSAVMLKQWMTLHTDLATYKMNAPIFQFNLDNSFNFGHGWVGSADAYLVTKGHSENLYFVRTAGAVNLSLTKSLMKDRLSIQLKGADLLHTEKHGTVMYAGSMQTKQISWYDSRQFVLTLRYKFNTTRSKYKGTGAGNDEKNRL